MHIIDQIPTSPSRFYAKFQRRLKLIAFAVASLTAVSVASAAGKPVTTLAVPANHAELQYTGRVDFTNPQAPTLNWAGNAVAIAFQGTALQVNLTCKTTNENNYLTVIVDGGTPTTLVASSRSTGATTYTVASGLAQGTHTARLIRRCDYDTVHGLTVNGFAIAGTTRAVAALPARPTRRIEFYGDSITTGMGNENPSNQGDMSKENNYLAYSAVTARNLGAEMTCISRSGIGIMSSWYPEIMPQVYSRLDPFNASSAWNFSLWTPDVVVINLGQNDFWTITSPDAATIETAYRNFFTNIRSKYPNALIVAALGCMNAVESGAPFPGYITNAVAAMNDPKIIKHFFPYLSGGYHPDVSQHAQMAAELTGVIQNAMGWPTGGPIANGNYTISAQSSGLPMCVVADSTALGANIEQRMGAASTQWSATYLGNGYYKLINVNSGLSVDVNGAQLSDGANILQWTYSGSNNQQYQFVDVGGALFKIVARHSGKVLALRANSTIDGGQFEQQTYTGATNQLFRLQ